MCFGSRQANFLETMFPAEEKSCLEGIDVAGTHKWDFARRAREGNLASFYLPHCKGFVLFGKGCSSKYQRTSSLTEWLSSALSSLPFWLEVSDPSNLSSEDTGLFYVPSVNIWTSVVCCGCSFSIPLPPFYSSAAAAWKACTWVLSKEEVCVAEPALGMGSCGLSPPKRLSCPPNQNVGKDSGCRMPRPITK